MSGINYPVIESITRFYSNVFWDLKDIEKITILTKSSIWFFFYDDLMDENPTQYDQWLKVFQKEESISSLNFEKMFLDFWTQIRVNLTEYQRKRFINSFISYVEASHRKFENQCHNYSLSEEDFLTQRVLTYNIDYCLVTFQFGLGISIDQHILNLDPVKSLHTNFAHISVLINDLYSFSKEYLSNGAKFNYISIMSIINKCSIQESVDLTIKKINHIESKILICVQEIIDCMISIPLEYLTRIKTYLFENLEFHKKSLRYQI